MFSVAMRSVSYTRWNHYLSKIGYSINSVYCDQIVWINHAQFFIFDDFGFKPCSEKQQSYLYEKASTIVASNRDFCEWLAVFSNPLMG